MLTLIKYGSGNVRAFMNIFRQLNCEFVVAERPEQLEGASKIILPGVGAFDQTMQLLKDSGFVEPLNRLVLEHGLPVLGVCVGMQIMAESSEEGDLPGLGWFKGRVRKINESLIQTKPFLPHLGWNSVTQTRESTLLEGLDFDSGFYFLHSYRLECQDLADVLLVAEYGEAFPAAVQRDNIWGFQFHPEKSHRNGIQLLKNFGELKPC